MKSRISLPIFLILIAKFSFYAVSSSKTRYDIQVEFEKFKTHFGKSYANKFEEFVARRNFENTLNLILDHNEAFDRGEKTYKLHLNAFADQNREVLRGSLVNRAPPMTITSGRAIGWINETRFPLGPEQVDWRESGCVTPVKDQSYFCNSCYAFSGVAALESHWCLKTGQLVTMSEQQLIDCNYHPRFGNWGCDGGSQATAYIYLSNFGIQSDSTYPYNLTASTRGTCRYRSDRVVARTSGYWRIRNRERELANVLAVVGPVSASMNGGIESFWYYADGVYSDPACRPSFSHAVLIVGYGTDNSYDPPMDYWICKNSW